MISDQGWKTHLMVLIETRIQLQPRSQEPNDLEVVMFSSLIIDGILPQVLQVFTNDDGQFDFLLKIIRQILQPEDSNSIRCSSLDSDGGQCATVFADVENDRSLVSVVDW